MKPETQPGYNCKMCGSTVENGTGICRKCLPKLIKESFDKYDKFLEKQKNKETK